MPSLMSQAMPAGGNEARVYQDPEAVEDVSQAESSRAAPNATNKRASPTVCENKVPERREGGGKKTMSRISATYSERRDEGDGGKTLSGDRRRKPKRTGPGTDPLGRGEKWAMEKQGGGSWADGVGVALPASARHAVGQIHGEVVAPGGPRANSLKTQGRHG